MRCGWTSSGVSAEMVVSNTVVTVSSGGVVTGFVAMSHVHEKKLSTPLMPKPAVVATNCACCPGTSVTGKVPVSGWIVTPMQPAGTAGGFISAVNPVICTIAPPIGLRSEKTMLPPEPSGMYGFEDAGLFVATRPTAAYATPAAASTTAHASRRARVRLIRRLK